MLKSTIGTLKSLALAVVCVSLVASTRFAQEPQVTLNQDSSDAIRQIGLRPPNLSSPGQQYRALVGLNMHAGLPAQKGACPPANFDANAPNLLSNPSFEDAGPRGRSASFPGRGNDARSAAAGWTMHTSNDLAKVTTQLIRSNRPGGGASMLLVNAGSNEGGVNQIFAPDNRGPERVVASAWVFVKRGRVAIGTGNNGFITNSVFSTTIGKWELLQACSDGTTTNNWFIIYSIAVEGSDFYADLAKVSEVRPCGGMVIERIVPNVTFPGGNIAINGHNFGRRQGTRVPAINRGRVDRLQVTRWTDTQILARSPLDLVGGTYRVLIYCDDSFRTSSNSLEVTVRDDIHRPR